MERTSNPSICRASVEGRTKVAASFIEPSTSAALRHSEVARDSASTRINAGGTTIDHGAPRIEIDHEVPARSFGRASDHHSACGVEAVNLHAAGSALARVSDGETLGLKSELGLRRMDVADEQRAVRAVLYFNAVCGHVDRRIAVVALQRRDAAFLLHLGRSDRGRRRKADCKNDAG